MASPYTGQFGDAWTGKQTLEMYTKELDGLRQKAEKGEIAQQDYVDYAKKVVPILEKENYALARISSDFNSILGPSYDAARNAMRDALVYSSARDLLGRDITAQEFAQFLPRFGTAGNEGDAAKKDIEAGRAYLAELASQEAKSPKALEKKAPEHYGKIDEQFKSLLGRDASANEKDYYGRLMATGEISPYEIEQYIKSGEEFQSGKDKTFREELSGELGKYRDEAFDTAQEKILSRQARMTGPHKSSNLDFALAQSAEDLQGETERYLTGVSASQYGGNKAAARADYEQMLQQYLAGKDYSTRRSDSYADYLTQRSFASVDYDKQMNDYLKYLESQPKQKKKGVGQMVGTLLGTGVGAMYGNPMAGAYIGGAGGGMFDFLKG